MPDDEWIGLALAWRAAAARYGARGAAQRLQRACGEGALQARGIPSTIPETREVVEIPASEFGRLTLDCPRSRIVRLGSRGVRKLPYYHSVEVRTAADEPLAQQAEENGALAPQQSLAGQVGDERLAQQAETDASPRREDADASVGEAGAGDALAREQEAAPIAAENMPASEAPPQQPPKSASTTETLLPKIIQGRKVKKVAAVLLGKWLQRPSDKIVDEMLEYVLTTIRPCSKATVERAIQRLTALGQWGE